MDRRIPFQISQVRKFRSRRVNLERRSGLELEGEGGGWTDQSLFLCFCIRIVSLPTAENIVAGMRWLIAGAAAGDSLFFHYSGHGIQIPDANNDEIDGLDEAIVPCDYPDGDFVVDDVIKKLLVDSIPYGARYPSALSFCALMRGEVGYSGPLPYV